MTEQRSYSKVEQKVRHAFRSDLNVADSTEDVKKFFVYAVRNFIDQAFEGRITVEYEDITLDPESENGFLISDKLQNNKEFAKAFANSDILQIFTRMGENALHRIKHLEDKLPDKTEAKMYPTPSHSGRFFRTPPVKTRPK